MPLSINGETKFSLTKICLCSIMDNTLAYEAGDCGSIPHKGSIHAPLVKKYNSRLISGNRRSVTSRGYQVFKESAMKRKMTVKQRNPFVVLALKRKAGSHRKTNKAVRRSCKVRDRGEAVSQQTFNLPIPSSNLGGPTI